MPIRVALHHKTSYYYDRLVTLQPQVIRLRPAPHCRTPILAYSLKVQPEQNFLNWQQDPYSNYQARVVFLKPTREFHVEVDLVAEMTTINPFGFFVEESAASYPFSYDAALTRELAPYLEAAPAGPRLQALVESLHMRDLRSTDYLVEINRRLHSEVRYVIRMEPGVQDPEETLTLRSGSCRDSSWLLVQVLRHLGLAARFVSGYLLQLVADVELLDGPPGPKKDFTDLHAWAEAYLPGAGWIGLDPTSGLMASEGHVPLACAADPTSAAPITGSFAWTPDPANEDDQCKEDFQFAMSIVRVDETPRVTKPYSDEQWQAIDALGQRVDRELVDHDVRLTMGGEPTFVSVDSRDAAEWNTAALGPHKRRQGAVLLKRLRDRFAPGALLHFGQGKWYPGETLPRWAYGCYWRRDGIPVWEDATLLGDPGCDSEFTWVEANHFVMALAARLGIDPTYCLPAYEDIWYYLWRERRLPANADPLDSKLDDAQERERLARIFDQGLGMAVGYALPLRRRHDGATPHWESAKWPLRREHLFLNPGDSPMGFRLPLDSLPWEAPAVRDMPATVDPFALHGPLASRPLAEPRFQAAAPKLNGQASRRGNKLEALVRTALCVEPRDGRLHVFMPPVGAGPHAEGHGCTPLDDYLDLVAKIEATAADLKVPVLIEGYTPPSDHRLNHFAITPDPGVLEVNIHPAHNWRELVDHTTTIYEEARLARLTAEKFQLDGRHTGTGGGNHVIIGGPTPADSPILRRPDLLRSLLGFWHNHPSLSYLFSSLFVGPTSQAPRIDEARNDSLFEMEIAFQQLASKQSPSLSPSSSPMPWIADRLFRHLLTDVTGNTHRAEFCIDKLYSPDTAEGRRGLVELRSFEMPPHARMSLVQQLLLRVLIAHFWTTPYQAKLARWGTALHDRFLLPHFVEQDVEDVLLELSQAGYTLNKEWFAPHIEFRFPLLGGITQRGIQLELRQAIEPWHVLGEEPAGGSTARFVDSSLERVQVKVRGLVDGRHVVTCNGRRVPLYATGVSGEFVAGIRYRAWQPPSCLHPTIEVHAPLVFDIYDTWTNRSIGGCRYHVAHPGGQSYESFPVNANEAESRRAQRFFAFGHSPGIRTLPPAELNPEFPLTLDLRQPEPASFAPTTTEARQVDQGDAIKPSIGVPLDGIIHSAILREGLEPSVPVGEKRK